MSMFSIEIRCVRCLRQAAVHFCLVGVCLCLLTVFGSAVWIWGRRESFGPANDFRVTSSFLSVRHTWCFSCCVSAFPEIVSTAAEVAGLAQRIDYDVSQGER